MSASGSTYREILSDSSNVDNRRGRDSLVQTNRRMSNHTFLSEEEARKHNRNRGFCSMVDFVSLLLFLP